jgi:Rho GTPase-activating protein 1
MDAHNLALCFSPNLVSSSSVVRDIQMCTIPSGPALPSELRASANSSHVPGSADNSATLGLIIKICIAQYFEIFEELADRTVALTSGPSLSSSLPTPTVHTLPDTPHSRPPQSNAVDSDDDDDLDGSMLVMSIGPSPSVSSPPPSAWSSPTRNGSGLSNSLIGLGHPSTSRSRLVGAQTHQRNDSAPTRLSASASSDSAISNASSHPNDVSPGTGRYSSIRAPSTMGGGGTARLKTVRSIISIEKAGEGTGVRSSYGSITIGKGTRRTSGAGVEAHGITVEGFFSPSLSPRSTESSPALEDTRTPE